ncbi:replication/maintenance protein RepL [Halomonas sp. QHL1]|uniref:replication/maintenance protein RepL n=1 Tax=Halomonas sp. QHL1 TaxID=1123773 RepID=UPI0008FD198F|nr:replication/maintenance protein RepL [Halomonas sp. QHL1]OJA05992.1 hypothetical protein QHL1GM_11675 [Halomonas sp. QHL1]
MGNNNIITNKDQNADFKTKTGFNKFAFLSFDKEGYVMRLRKYETNIRRKIKQLREDKKLVSNEATLKAMEQEIKQLKAKLLNNTDNAVLYYFIEHVDYKNKVDMDKVRKTQTAIANELCLDNAEVSRAFKKLKELNIISFTKSGHALEKVLVSPFIIWRGKAQDHYDLMQELKAEFTKKPFEVKLKAA